MIDRIVCARVLAGGFLGRLLLLVPLGFFLPIRFAVKIRYLALCIFCQAVLWIAVQKLFKGTPCLLSIVEVVFINLTDREEGVASIFAARILPPQELILCNGLIQNLVVVEAAAHFDQRLRHRDHAGICLGRGGRAVVDAAVGIEDPLVVAPRTLAGRASIKRFPHALGAGKAFVSPCFPVMRPRIGRQSGEGQQQQRRSPARGAPALCNVHSRRSVTVLIRRCR